MLTLTNIGVIKRFFESGKHGRKIELAELKALSTDERNEIATLCARVFGMKEDFHDNRRIWKGGEV